MRTKVFVDVNIVIDLIEKREFELEFTKSIFLLAEQNNIEVYISESVISNALYITNLPKQLNLLLEIVNTINISREILKKALESDFKDKEDAILYYGALDNKMDYFITRNKKDFIKFSEKNLPVLSAKEFCTELEK
jgi:predicted nucleic acid-binding protein